MDLYHLVLMLLLEQQDEVITVTGIHVHPLTSGAQLTNARQIALFIYLKSDVVRTRLCRGQSYLGRVQDAIERDWAGIGARCLLGERRLSVLTRGTHANARDKNAVLTRNKRAMTVLHPRLPAKILRPTACNHVLTAAVARPSTFVPRLYRVFTACVPRVPPAITRGLNFWAAQNFFARPTACEFLTACNNG